MTTPLNPFEIKQFVATHGGRAVMAILSAQTCGEACWHAREDVCRCSCGGRNHGCLTHGGATPERTSKIDGAMYRLKSVGVYADIVRDACEINRLAGYSSVCKPQVVIGGQGKDWSEADVETARASGQEVWWSQYKYTWRTTDSGAPARLKSATASQMKWTELTGWKDERRKVYLLWELVDKPKPPTELVVDRETGLPLADQLPTHCHA